MKRAAWLLLFPLAAMVSCVTYNPPAPSPAASVESDAQAKRFSPPQGKGDIYVSRPDEIVLFGKPAVFGVTVDGNQVGGLLPGMYYCIALEPGNHGLGATSEMSSSNLTVSVEAGKNYYFQLTAADNTGKLSLSMVILEPMGKLMIQNTKRAQGSME